MERRATITIIDGNFNPANNNISTPGDEYNQSYSPWKIVRQMKAIKDTIKEQVGLGSVIGTISLICSAITVIVLIGTPAVRQGELNGTYGAQIDRLVIAQKDNDERQTKQLNEAVTRIEAGIKQAVDLALQNREEMRSMRTSTDGAFVELRQDTKGLWKWATSIDGRVGVLEAEIRNRKEK